MILRPVTPQSALGPPTTNEPVGFTSTSRSSWNHEPSTSGHSFLATYRRISSWETSAECIVDTRTVFTATGLPAPLYSTETWVFESGLSHFTLPALRTSGRGFPSL